MPLVAMECRMPCSWPEGSLHCSLVPSMKVGTREVLKPGLRESRLKMIRLFFQPPWVELGDDHGKLRTKHIIPQTTGQMMLFPGNPTANPSGVFKRKKYTCSCRHG